MRLIELRLKNLNSLKGEWHIDFADPAFVNEGIFAITGQTGAGKTTILDAIVWLCMVKRRALIVLVRVAMKS